MSNIHCPTCCRPKDKHTESEAYVCKLPLKFVTFLANSRFMNRHSISRECHSIELFYADGMGLIELTRRLSSGEKDAIVSEVFELSYDSMPLISVMPYWKD